MMENMKINQLPSKTWNWLKMNETAVSGISVSGAHEGNLETPANCQAVQWLAFASNAFNTLVPFYAAVDETPEYLANTTKEVSTENFYWSARMIAAMADASFAKSAIHIERYQNAVEAKGHALLNKYDKEAAKVTDPAESRRLLEEANREIAKMLKEETGNTLDRVLFELSNSMKNAFSRSDA